MRGSSPRRLAAAKAKEMKLLSKNKKRSKLRKMWATSVYADGPEQAKCGREIPCTDVIETEDWGASPVLVDNATIKMVRRCNFGFIFKQQRSFTYYTSQKEEVSRCNRVFITVNCYAFQTHPQPHACMRKGKRVL